MTNIIKGTEPFFIKKGDVECLLVYGFTGTPNEHRELGKDQNPVVLPSEEILSQFSDFIMTKVK